MDGRLDIGKLAIAQALLAFDHCSKAKHNKNI